VNIAEELEYLLQAAPFPMLPELEEMARGGVPPFDKE
jgi:hypothetical protein